MSMKRYVGYLLPVVALVLLASCVPSTAAAPKPVVPVSPITPPQTAAPAAALAAAPVPTEYQALYDSLSRQLDEFDRTVQPRCKAGTKPVMFAAELLSANSNIGEKLLTDANFEGAKVYLDAMQRMGITGVTISLSYPFFTPGFSNNDRYLDFYKKVIQECRARKMKVLIDNGNPFFNTPFSDVNYSLKGITLEKWRVGKRQTTETILKELRPDYLSVSNEPSTEDMLLGIRQTPAQYAQTVAYIINGLKQESTLLAAGTGTWSDMNYIRELVKLPELDYIDMHIYPLKYLEGTLTAADIATSAGKKLVIGEMWLYKVRDTEITDLGQIATQTTMFGRDVYSFWAPLDGRFLQVMARMSECTGYEFITPFWSTCLFGYVDYDSSKNLSYGELRQKHNREAYANMLKGGLSASGEAYRDAIRSASKP
jgi:hypothetical protein